MSTRMEKKYRPHRYFIKLLTPGASPYAMGPTTKGYPKTEEGRERARKDAAEQWGVDKEDVQVWPASTQEYGYGEE